MTELEIEKLERNLAENESYKEEESNADGTSKKIGEVRDISTTLEPDEAVENPEEEEVVINEVTAEMLERRQKDKLPALRDIPKKKLFEKIAKVDKVLCRFKTHSITKTNNLFYAGAVVVTNSLVERINKEAGRKKPMSRRRLQNKVKELRKDLSQLKSSKDKEVSNVMHWQT